MKVRMKGWAGAHETLIPRLIWKQLWGLPAPLPELGRAAFTEEG